jgi:hypothetical protein
MLDGASVSCFTGEKADIRGINDILMEFCDQITNFSVALRHIADKTKPDSVEIDGKVFEESSTEYYLALIGSKPKLDG